jgi:thiol:disulfide interchange protein DsbD
VVRSKLAITLSTLCFLAVVGASALGAEQTLLEPEQAFRFSARLVSDDTLEISYRIADGYYLYKDRFSFTIEHDAVKLGHAQFPAGEWHEDEFFGRSVIYRRAVTIRIPIESPSRESGFTLLGVSQGCADAGVCYLPATHRARLAEGTNKALGLPRQ